MKRRLPLTRILLCALLLLFQFYYHTATAQTFTHPGGLHKIADLDRMKARVAAGEHPWIDGWNELIADPWAQKTYTPAARANMGSSRQRADQDAHAAYLNAIRWYISGDTSYAACARKILNAWSAAVDTIPYGTDIPGLSGIPVFDFALAAEVLRIYPGWASADFDRFKNMMRTYFYPVCHSFLVNHNGACISNSWANWDICNIGALISMGVLLDDSAIYNEGVNYFKNGAGTGSIKNAVYYIHPNGLGQWQESGRDQSHAMLGVGMMAYLCQVAWNQGTDLFAYDNSRLLAGAEYVARTNLSQPVPYVGYNNCQNANQRWVSTSGMGRLNRPVWELLYNHYVVTKGLSAPNVTAMAQVMRPEAGSIDHFGYGTLTFTLNNTASPYPPSPIPAAPAGVSANAGVSRVELTWTAPAVNNVQGYTIQRSATAGGPYTTIGSLTNNTYPVYADESVSNGTTYYYVITAYNQSGTSSSSAEVIATPMASSTMLPTGWTRQDIGAVSVSGSASYASESNHTFITSGAGPIGSTTDACGFAYSTAAGDFTITARMIAMGGDNGKTGIMIRETLDPNSKTFIMKRGDVGWRQAAFGMRTTTGGAMTWKGGNDYTNLQAWFRLQRTGNTITGFESHDGIAWFQVGTATVSMNNNCYVGLFNASTSASLLSTTTFDNVTITSGATAVPGRAAYWKFDEGSGTAAQDSWGSNTATLQSGASWSSGLVNNAVRLDSSSNGYVSLGSMDFSEAMDLTISAWIRFDEKPVAWARIFDIGSGSNLSSTMYLIPNAGETSDGKQTIRFAVYANGSTNSKLNYNYAWQPGVWTHIAITQSGSTAKMYINGILVAQTTFDRNPSNLGNTTNNTIGRSQRGTTDPFLKGSIDEFMIYNRALSASEIAKLVQEPGAPSVPAVLSVTGDNDKVWLTWATVSAATGYNIKRATQSGGPYITIASIPDTFLNDGSLPNDNVYYYVVSAVNEYGESANSNEVKSSESGKVGYWKFDETSGTTAADSWANGVGTLHSGASLTSGIVNNCVHLDGSSNGYVDLPAGLLSTARDFTISTWVKLDTVISWARVFDFGTENANSMYLIPQTAVTNGKSTIRFGIKTSKTTQQMVTYDYTWSKNIWTHIAVTLRGDTAKMYINGSLVASNTNYTYRPSDLGITINNYLGKGQLTSDPYLKGSIDEFKVYNRALSASEIATIASNSSSRLATVESPTVTRVEGLKVYPNPVKDQLTFQLSNDFQNGTTLKLMDVNGRVMYNKKISGVQYKLQVDQLPSGTYFIQLNNGSRIITQKIVKK